MKLFKLLVMAILLSTTFTSCEREPLASDSLNAIEKYMPTAVDFDKSGNFTESERSIQEGWGLQCGNIGTGEQIHVNYNYSPPEWMLWADHNGDGSNSWSSIEGINAHTWCRNNATITDLRWDGVECSDPNGSDWVEARLVNGVIQYFLHTMAPLSPMISAEGEITIKMSFKTATAQCTEWSS
tara:strand:- start:101 stop:649 length:549 start_codon:yes stop_codon:yes gene_type:complete